jgi:phosphoribosylformylglycinamidine (FGAM) synthase-like enzyme
MTPYDLAFKVETHNHPSALEPFGGANTGVGGVIRDVMGVSRAAPSPPPTCSASARRSFPLDQVPEGMLHPRASPKGVVAGVGDYGNKMGIPTVNGAMIYDEGYTATRSSFAAALGCCRTASTRPARGRATSSWRWAGAPGATACAAPPSPPMEMDAPTHEVAGSSVQIGDPITEKGLIEVIEAARDRACTPPSPTAARAAFPPRRRDGRDAGRARSTWRGCRSSTRGWRRGRSG